MKCLQVRMLGLHHTMVTFSKVANAANCVRVFFFDRVWVGGSVGGCMPSFYACLPIYPPTYLPGMHARIDTDY